VLKPFQYFLPIGSDSVISNKEKTGQQQQQLAGSWRQLAEEDISAIPVPSTIEEEHQQLQEEPEDPRHGRIDEGMSGERPPPPVVSSVLPEDDEEELQRQQEVREQLAREAELRRRLLQQQKTADSKTAVQSTAQEAGGQYPEEASDNRGDGGDLKDDWMEDARPGPQKRKASFSGQEAKKLASGDVLEEDGTGESVYKMNN
jgi:type IV secretory pathway VirB10-like protein